MDTSVFLVKTEQPGEQQLKAALGKAFPLWASLKTYAEELFSCEEEWNFSKFGWNARLKEKKRVIVYLMPCSGYFNASFVFGEKTAAAAEHSNVGDDIKSIINKAPVYGEGRGFRIAVRDKKILKDIQTLVLIKTQN